MANSHQYAVHEDFRKFPVMTFKFNSLFMGLINCFFRAERGLRQRKALKQAVTHRVTSDGGHRVKVLQFNPANAPSNTEKPALLFFHGGAFAMTYASSHIESAKFYADQTGCTVFLVDYRLALAAPYPAAFDDCYAALEWVADNAQQLGVDTTRIAVAGDSAGGGLAAGVAQRALDEGKIHLCAQLLVYPTLDSSCGTESAKNYVDTPMWNALSNGAMWKCYLRDLPAGSVPEYASPLQRGDLQGLATSYVETAEFDPLVDEGHLYAERLERANVRVSVHKSRGTVHGYDAITSSAISQESLRKRIEFLKTVF